MSLDAMPISFRKRSNEPQIVLQRLSPTKPYVGMEKIPQTWKVRLQILYVR